MTLVIHLLACHHWRAPQVHQDGCTRWSELPWERAEAPMHDIDALLDTARAARAMQELDLMQIPPSRPVVLGPETTGWDGERCFSTAMPVAERDGCYLVPFQVAESDALWLFFPDLRVATRPAIHGTAHGVTLACTQTAGRVVADVEPDRTRVIAVPGGAVDSGRCPNAPTLSFMSGESGAWIRAGDQSVPFERVDRLFDEAPAVVPFTPAERIWEVEMASTDGVQYYRFRDRISHVRAVVPSAFMNGQTDQAVFYYDLDGSGCYELELTVTRPALTLGWFDGDEDGRADSCWWWETSGAGGFPSTLGQGSSCPGAAP